MELGVLGAAGYLIEVRWLGQDGNCSTRESHLDPFSAFSQAANLVRTLKAQDARAFPLVFAGVKLRLASL
jgi:hypothetical protein